ncbi:hypothetical protein [Rufibacter ruber]|uniref:hypothetical protein n=1 Tax=Rufibacter ruber TaxID=1783499 RepID=UPI00082CE976|nr:hypothetical protein [Rufibacter ruber]
MGFHEKQFEWYNLTLETVALRLSEENSRDFSVEDIGLALAEIFGFTDNTELHAKVFSEGLNIYHILKDYYFSEKLGQVELGEGERISLAGNDEELFEALVKNRNQVWQIHKNDKDPHPSNPHGHNYSSGLKLDLSNGDLYHKRKKRSKIDKKELIAIREKCKNRGIELPPLSLN